MAKPITTSVSGVGTSTAVPINLSITPVHISLAVTLSAGSNLVYTVEHTYDDLKTNDDLLKAQWFPFLTDISTNSDGFYAYPILAVRVRVTSHTSGTATLRVIQAGS